MESAYREIKGHCLHFATSKGDPIKLVDVETSTSKGLKKYLNAPLRRPFRPSMMFKIFKGTSLGT